MPSKISQSLIKRARLLSPVLGLLLIGVFVSGLKASDVMTDVDVDVKTFAISGRVVNQLQKPVSGVPVTLWEKDGDLTMESKSDGSGAFKFVHKPCGDLCLQVAPDSSLKLASALIEDLPGGETRKMIVELKTGYLVTGRVTHEGKGLKGLIVRVTAAGNADKRTRVHGGGADETGRGGTFRLILTPGDKKLVIINEKYPECAKHVTTTFNVSDDTHLGKIELP